MSRRKFTQFSAFQKRSDNGGPRVLFWSENRKEKHEQSLGDPVVGVHSERNEMYSGFLM